MSREADTQITSRLLFKETNTYGMFAITNSYLKLNLFNKGNKY